MTRVAEYEMDLDNHDPYKFLNKSYEYEESESSSESKISDDNECNHSETYSFKYESDNSDASKRDQIEAYIEQSLESVFD